MDAAERQTIEGDVEQPIAPMGKIHGLSRPIVRFARPSAREQQVAVTISPQGIEQRFGRPPFPLPLEALVVLTLTASLASARHQPVHPHLIFAALHAGAQKFHDEAQPTRLLWRVRLTKIA